MLHVVSALRPAPFQVNGMTTSWPLPWWTILTRVGSRSTGTGARPRAVSTRTKCFIDTVSPARKRAAVEDGRGAQVGLGAATGRHIEAPRLDALLPAAEDEGDVGRAALGVTAACAHEVAAVGNAALRVRLERARDDGETLGVALAVPERLAVAVVDDDVGAFDRPAAVERRHPDDAVLAAELEVDAEVGDEDAGANEHRRALVEQRLAEPQRLDLDDVVARLGERDADDLERARVVAGELRQVEAGRARFLGEQRDFARADVLARRDA